MQEQPEKYNENKKIAKKGEEGKLLILQDLEYLMEPTCFS